VRIVRDDTDGPIRERTGPDAEEPRRGRLGWSDRSLTILTLAAVGAVLAVATVARSTSPGAPDAPPPAAVRSPGSGSGPMSATTAPTTSPDDSPTGSPSPEPRPLSPSKASIIDLETGRVTRLSPRIRAISAPTQFAVCPCGGRLAFAAGGSIYVTSLDGRDLRKVATVAGASAPSWSPDGTRLVFATSSRIFVVRLSSGDVAPLTGDLEQVWRPTFSPDGRTILFTRASSRPLDEDLARRLDLWTVPANGGRPTLLLRLENGQEHAAFGAYGPDGTIAYRRTNYDGTAITPMTTDVVWLVDATGEHRRMLGTWRMSMSQVNPNALWPAWSPDGTRIAYEPAYGRGIRLVDVRTGRIRRLSPGINPIWLDEHRIIIEAFSQRGWWA